MSLAIDMMSARFVKALFELCRISNLPTIWSNVLAAVVLSGAGFQWQSYLVVSLSVSLFYSGGMCLNDICDAAIDRAERPARPIPSGKVSLQGAYILAVLLFFAAMFLLYAVPYNSPALLSGLLLLAVIIAYDKFHKANFYSVFLMASCRLLVFVVSALSVAGRLGTGVIIAGSVQFIYVLVISIVARQENRRGARFSFPVIPAMIAAISVVDGIIMAVLASPLWLAAGIFCSVMTLLGQKLVKGD